MTDTPTRLHPRPIKAAHELLITKLAAMLPDVPRLSIDADPSEFEDVADYLCEAARIFDQWLLAVGREVKANAPCKIDMDCFTDVVLNVVEGFSTAECTKCAETIKEDRSAA
jgi:hypothetical protein